MPDHHAEPLVTDSRATPGVSAAQPPSRPQRPALPSGRSALATAARLRAQDAAAARATLGRLPAYLVGASDRPWRQASLLAPVTDPGAIPVPGRHPTALASPVAALASPVAAGASRPSLACRTCATLALRRWARRASTTAWAIARAVIFRRPRSGP